MNYTSYANQPPLGYKTDYRPNISTDKATILNPSNAEGKQYKVNLELG